MKTVTRAVAASILLLLAWLLGGSRRKDEARPAPMILFVAKHPWLTAGACGSRDDCGRGTPCYFRTRTD